MVPLCAPVVQGTAGVAYSRSHMGVRRGWSHNARLPLCAPVVQNAAGVASSRPQKRVSAGCGPAMRACRPGHSRRCIFSTPHKGCAGEWSRYARLPSRAQQARHFLDPPPSPIGGAQGWSRDARLSSRAQQALHLSHFFRAPT